MQNNAARNVESLQSTGAKQSVRKEIAAQVHYFSEAHHIGINYLGLPATDAITEKMLCRKLGASLHSVCGVEYHPALVCAVRTGMKSIPMPAESKTFMQGDVDEIIASNVAKFNVFWPDYCGNFAESYGPAHRPQYRYPHLKALVNVVRNAVQPTLYYLTVNLTCAHLFGGRDQFFRALGGSAASMDTALCSYIRARLDLVGLLHKVTPVFKVVYNGGTQSRMMTVGFLIGATPDANFPIIDRVDSRKEKVEAAPATANAPTTGNSEIALKTAILLMLDAKFDKNTISKAFNCSYAKVRAMQAHITMGTYGNIPTYAKKVAQTA